MRPLFYPRQRALCQALSLALVLGGTALHTNALCAPKDIPLSGLNGKNGFQMVRLGETHELGFSVSIINDVNNDGLDDMVIGAGGTSFQAAFSGSAYVVFGRSTPMPTGQLDLASLDGANGFRIDGEKQNDVAGQSVSSAGDINGDGFNDILIGSPWAKRTDPVTQTDTYIGSAFVVFGRSTGFPATLPLSGLTAGDGFRINAPGESNRGGFSVSNLGDVNGDQIDDVMMSVPYADFTAAESGSTYVIFGRDKNQNNLFPSVLELSALNTPTDGFRIDGPAKDAGLFGKK